MYCTLFRSIKCHPCVCVRGIKKYSAEEIVCILLDKTLHQGYVCKQQPLGVKESKVFIVDTNKLNHPDDIKADKLGSGKNDGQHPRWVKVKQQCSMEKSLVLSFVKDGLLIIQMCITYIKHILFTDPIVNLKENCFICQVSISRTHRVWVNYNANPTNKHNVIP